MSDEVQDLSEPFSDNNNNGEYDPGEHFVDSNNDTVWSPGDGLWNGLNCAGDDRCAEKKSVDLGQQITLIISNPASTTICSSGDFEALPANIATGSSISLGGLYISDGNRFAVNAGHPCPIGNPLPEGSRIKFDVSAGELIGPTEFVVGGYETHPSGPYSVTYTAPLTAGPQSIDMSVSTRYGNEFSYSWTIEVFDPADE